MLGKREEAQPMEYFRKCLYKGEQKKVHEFKGRVGNKYIIWNGERSVVKEGNSINLKGDSFSSI